MKKSLPGLEAALRRLIDLQQHKLVPRFPPDQNGLLVCREVFLYLMHVPASTYIQMLLKISDPNAPTRDWHKKLAQQLADWGPVAANQIRWLRNKAEQVAQNVVALKDQHGTVTPKAKNTAWQHAGRRSRPRPRLGALDQAGGTPGRLPWPGVPWSQCQAGARPGWSPTRLEPGCPGLERQKSAPWRVADKYHFPSPAALALCLVPGLPKAPAGRRRGGRAGPGVGLGHCQGARPPPPSLGAFSGEEKGAWAWAGGRGGGGGRP
jgi:hypothetical protein